MSTKSVAKGAKNLLSFGSKKKEVSRNLTNLLQNIIKKYKIQQPGYLEADFLAPALVWC